MVSVNQIAYRQYTKLLTAIAGEPGFQVKETAVFNEPYGCFVSLYSTSGLSYHLFLGRPPFHKASIIILAGPTTSLFERHWRPIEETVESTNAGQ